MPSQSIASTAIPRLARPPQVALSAAGRPVIGQMTHQQLQQQAVPLSQQQLQQLQVQQRKAYQQRLLEQQIYAQQNVSSQHMPLSVTAHDRDESLAAPPFYVAASDINYSQNAHDVSSQQMLCQQMYEAALVQQQQHMKSTVSAGAINLMQHPASDAASPPTSSASCQFDSSQSDQMSVIRRASEGQVYTTATTCLNSSVENVSASHSVTSSQSQSTDTIPSTAVPHTTDDPPFQYHVDTFKVPFPPYDVRS